MTDTTAKIAAKGCNNTGITEALAEQLHAQLGKKLVAVVELVSENRTESRDGKEKVGLSILTIEPAPNADTEDHLRELARAFHFERKLAEDGPQLPVPGDGPEPKVADVLAAGRAHLPHDYLPVGDDVDQCDLCGETKDNALHTADQADDGDAELDLEDTGDSEELDVATDWVDPLHGDEPEQPDNEHDEQVIEVPEPDDNDGQPTRHLGLANPFTATN